MSKSESAESEHIFGEQHAVCQIDDCEHVVRSMHSVVLLMKFDTHLQDEHDTTLEDEAEQYLDGETECD